MSLYSHSTPYLIVSVISYIRDIFATEYVKIVHKSKVSRHKINALFPEAIVY
jgi:hypothetical protein